PGKPGIRFGGKFYVPCKRRPVFDIDSIQMDATWFAGSGKRRKYHIGEDEIANAGFGVLGGGRI
ncbi:MAG: hypothetical protein ACKVKG_05910, partial [Alphaproteobacteria bacterium]